MPVVFCLAALLLVAGAEAHAQTCPAPDPATASDGFYNVLPGGQGGNATLLQMNPPHFADQLNKYADLILGYRELTPGDMTYYFKEETLYPRDAESTETPRPGVCIIRDGYGVPHIYGDTAADVAFGAGWATAEDHLFEADTIRHLGRGRLSALIGPSESNLASDRAVAAQAGYTEDELQAQFDRLAMYGDEGRAIQAYFVAFVDGMNAYIAMARLNPTILPIEYPALQILLEDWKVTDIVAAAIPVQALLAGGGGFELHNADLLSTLRAKYPEAKAKAIYRDLVNRNDPDAPTTIEDSFPYLDQPAQVDPAATAIPDLGSVSTVDLTVLKQKHFSNFLAVTAGHAAGNRPIAVMGPQVAYFAPEILMELDLHGGGIDARGVSFVGLGGLVLIGRNQGFAWSATSGSSDEIDLRVEKLCNPNGSAATAASTAVMFNGACTPMYERDDTFIAKPTAGGIGLPQLVTVHVERSIHGPIIGRATVGGAPVAIARQRSTFGGEADTALGFWRLNNGSVHDPASFFAATAAITGSFNWLYVSATDLAYFHSGRYPVRAAGVDPELPTWGTGAWEWTGAELPPAAHPQSVNPKKGFITSWNNKPARDWRSADGYLAWSTVYRSQLLDARVQAAMAAHGRVDMLDLVKAMADAATVDLRGEILLPLALRVLADRPEVAPYVALLQQWVADGAHRLDRSRRGRYDDEAAIALMDAWYPRLVHAIFDPQLDGVYGAIGLGFDDANRTAHRGSAFDDGWYGLVEKALGQALGMTPKAPFAVLGCGDGTRAGCAAALAPSLLAAVDDVSKVYGSDPTAWKAPKAGDQIEFQAIGLTSVPPIDWQNRPTFQQVVQVGGEAMPGEGGPPEGSDGSADAGVLAPDAASPDAATPGETGESSGCAVGGGRQGMGGVVLLVGLLMLLVRRRSA